MNENAFEKIEDYLNNRMSTEEKALFESEMAADEELVSSYQLYSSIENEMNGKEKYRENEVALKNTLHKLNQTYFNTTQQHQAKVIPFKSVYKMVASIAAILILVVASYFLFNRSSEDPQRLANTYIENNFAVMPQTMDGGKDSLQMGLTAYNKKDYKTALSFFTGVVEKNPSESDAKKYTGIVYLVMSDYDNALKYFNGLAEMKGLFNNPGMFLKALTLLERNKDRDKENAKQILQQVVKENADGSKQAKEWLEKL